MPSLSDVRTILNKAKFNPKKPGPLNVVAHSAGPSYLESRATEFIMEGQLNRQNLRGIHSPIMDKESAQKELKRYKHNLIRGIQCLALAIAKVERGEF